MLLPAILFLFYFLLLLLLITKLDFIKKSGLGKKALSILFLLKILAGIAATWYGYVNAGDLAVSFQNSLQETALLKRNPSLFFTSIFTSGYGNYDGLYSTHSYWNDLRYMFLDKLLGILNLFSFSNIYINVLLYNTLIFFGQVALYRIFISQWHQKKWAVMAGCFLLPSSLFFLSCINKDSMFFLAAVMVFYALYKIPHFKKSLLQTKPLLLLTAGLFLMFIIRNFFLMAALPAIMCYYLCTLIKIKPGYIFMAVFGMLAILIFTSADIMEVMSSRQNEFLTLGNAKSLVAVPELKPGFGNFIAYLPISISMVFLRPYIWHSYNTFYFLSGLEMLLYQLLLIAAVYYTVKRRRKDSFHPLVLYGIFFSMTALLIIGYTIPYLGAVVRYKTAFLPFLITPLLAALPVEKITPAFFRRTTL